MAVAVPLEGAVMQLRRSELESVALPLNAPSESIVEAVRQLPVNERAPVWELSVRHYGRRRPLEQAAGEIGMDLIHAKRLIKSFTDLVITGNSPNR